MSLRYMWKSTSLTTSFFFCMTKPPGRLNIKMIFPGIGIFHYKDKTVMRLSYLYNGNFYIVKMAFWYWNCLHRVSAPFTDIIWVSSCFVSPASGGFYSKAYPCKIHQNSGLLILCEGNPSVNGGFPSQRASDVESILMLWHHHAGTDYAEMAFMAFILHDYFCLVCFIIIIIFK